MSELMKAANGSAAQIEPELLTKAEVAHLLGVSTRMVDSLVRQRRIAFARLSRKTVRFPRRAILAHISEHLTFHARRLEGR